jgi:peptide/nickel transport system substrate-binding protein
MAINRRRALAGGLGAVGLGSFVLPRIAIAQADTRPSLTVAVQKVSNSNTLEPLREQSNVGTRVIYSIMETMIDLDWTGDLRPVPTLAERWRRIDDRTVELTLREGVRFHNGDPLTAEDVAFSFGQERMWSSTPEDRRGAYVSLIAGATGKTPPAEVTGIARSSFPGFERIEIVDRRTVRFMNRVPDLTLEGRLVRNTAAIVSQRAFAEAPSWLEWARRPVGTGPYKIRQYRPDNDLVLDAFDDYWGGRPPLRSIRFIEVPEVSSRVNGLLAGDFDFVCDIPPDQIAGIERRERWHVVGGLIPNIRITAFDKTNAPLQDPRVRRAMSHAVDRQAIVDALWLGRASVPKGLQWDFFGDMLIADWSNPAHDPALARSLLAEAGYRGEAIRYQLLNNYYTNQVPTAQILVEGWHAVGLNVQIEMKENWSQILERTPQRGICDNSNTAWFNDPVASMAGFGPGGQQWEAQQWRSDDALRAFTEMQTSTDPARRKLAFRRMIEICEREDPAYIVLHQSAQFTGKRRDLRWKPPQGLPMDFRASNWGSAVRD